MRTPFSERQFKSFDGSFEINSKYYSPDRYRNLENIFLTEGPFCAQGSCLSYPALSFGDGSSVIEMRHFNRILGFDESLGVIEVEAGMTLGQLASFSLPRGWYLKVQPGHPSISIGGCLSTDVHGKNQFTDSNFKEHVRHIKIYHPDFGYLTCDRETNPDIFDLTCGGWGLTGVILSIGLQLGKLVSLNVITETQEIESIFDLPAVLTEKSSTADLIYTWHDFNTNRTWGKGFLKTGTYLAQNGKSANLIELQLEHLRRSRPLSSSMQKLPSNLLNKFGVRLLNSAYSFKETSRNPISTVSLIEFLFPVIDKTVYYKLFGYNGFHESQVLIPIENFASVMTELRRGIERFSVPITLASCKLFKGRQQLLRFIGTGIVLAINLPRSPDAYKFLTWWDGIVKDNGCLPNITKDSRIPVETIRNCYKEFELFASGIKSFDPKRRFKNQLSVRLEI